MNTLRKTLSVPAVHDAVQPPYVRLGGLLGTKSELGAVLARKTLQDLVRNLTVAPNEEFMLLVTTCAGYIRDDVSSRAAQNGLRVLHTTLGKRTCAVAFRDQKYCFDEVACAAVNGFRKNVDLAYALDMIKRAARFGLLVPTADLKSALTALKLDNTRGAGVQTLLDETTEQVFPTRASQDSSAVLAGLTERQQLRRLAQQHEQEQAEQLQQQTLAERQARHDADRGAERVAKALTDVAQEDALGGTQQGGALGGVAAADAAAEQWVECDRCNKWRKLPDYVDLKVRCDTPRS